MGNKKVFLFFFSINVITNTNAHLSRKIREKQSKESVGKKRLGQRGS